MGLIDENQVGSGVLGMTESTSAERFHGYDADLPATGLPYPEVEIVSVSGSVGGSGGGAARVSLQVGNLTRPLVSQRRRDDDQSFAAVAQRVLQ